MGYIFVTPLKDFTQCLIIGISFEFFSKKFFLGNLISFPHYMF